MCVLYLRPAQIEAQRYRMDLLLDKSVKFAAELSLNELENRVEYCDIEKDTLLKLYRCRVRTLEKELTELMRLTETKRGYFLEAKTTAKNHTFCTQKK